MSTETKSTHITPVGGNIFADLGFEPEEAARLLAETEKAIAEKRAMKQLSIESEDKISQLNLESIYSPEQS